VAFCGFKCLVLIEGLRYVRSDEREPIDIFFLFFFCFGMFTLRIYFYVHTYIIYSIGEDTKGIYVLHDHGQGLVETGGGTE